MRNTAPCLIALALGLGAGCAYQPADFPSQEELYDAPPSENEDEHYPGFVLRSGEHTVFTARIHDGGILGPLAPVNLGRYRDPDDHAIRGVAFGQRVELKVDEKMVSGVVEGVLPVHLVGVREDGALHIRGVVRGYFADYRLDDHKLSGTLGRCSYHLTRAGEHHYKGMRSCGGELRDVKVKLPPELTRWSDPEIGAALGILLGGC